MKKYISIALFCLLLVNCTIKKRDNLIVWHYNYFEPETLIIETDCPFFTDNQFLSIIPDTTKMIRFDRDTHVQLRKAMNRADYSYAVINQDESRMAELVNIDSIIVAEKFTLYLYGKLNLQPNINSFLVISTYSIVGVGSSPNHTLYLCNIKADRLCSIIFLCSLRDKLKYPIEKMDDSSFSTSIKNKIFTRTISTDAYFTFDFFGHEFQGKRDEVAFSTYKIDKNGFLKFTKN